MYFDLLLLFLILIVALFGYIRGFVSQVISLLALLSVIFLAQPLAIWLKESSGWNWFQNAPRLVLWGVSTYFIFMFYLGVSGIVFLIRRGAGLSPADRWIGCALGAVKGFVFAVVISLGFQLLPEHAQERFTELHADAEDSVFMKTTKPMLNWSFHSSFQSLQEIKAYLKAPKKETSSKQGDPWAQGLHPESE